MARRVGIAQATQTAIRAAIANGLPVKRTRTQAYTLTTANSTLTLLNADGTATANGRFYYKAMDLPLPTAYAYEQELIDDKFVLGWEGNKILVRRRDTEGNWVPTSAGRQYFKYLRDEYQVSVPGARPARNGETFILESIGPVVLSERFFTVPYLRTPEARAKLRTFLTNAERDAWLTRTTTAYLTSLPTRKVGDAYYHVIYFESTDILWVPDMGLMKYSKQRTKVHDNQADPTVTTILNRPLLDYCLPEGAWRPYELHQNSFKKFEAGCVVQMVFDSFVIKKRASGGARRAGFSGITTSQGATIREIEEDFDIIFDELGYKNGEYPFEHSWRRCGATPQMVLAYAKRHGLKCFVHFKDKVVATFRPEVCNGLTHTLNFSVFANHCYFFASSADCEKTFANNASSQKTVQEEPPP